MDNVEGLRMLLYDGTQMKVGATPQQEFDAIIAAGGAAGEIYSRLRAIREQYGELIRARYPQIPRRVSGYNLDEFLPENSFHVARALVGTEGTCVTVLEAKVRLIHSPQHRSVGRDWLCGRLHRRRSCAGNLAFGPIGLEGFEGSIVDGLRKKGAPKLELLPEGRRDPAGRIRLRRSTRGELRATNDRAAETVAGRAACAALHARRSAKGCGKSASRAHAPRCRPGAPPEWEGWDDAAVAPEKLGAYLRDIRKLLNEYDYHGRVLRPFRHGCIHMRVSFDLESERGIRKYRRIRRARRRPRGALRRFAFGRAWRRAIARRAAAENVRAGIGAGIPRIQGGLGSGEQDEPAQSRERLSTDREPAAGRGLQAAASWRRIFNFPTMAVRSRRRRCAASGSATAGNKDSGTMCPSYMATMEEEHSTRGRAHMLFRDAAGGGRARRLAGRERQEGAGSVPACKACKSECPTNVDIATYRAEFLSHYYEGRRRPLHAEFFGTIDRWARLASFSPGAANLLSHAPGFEGLIRLLLRLPRERKLPRFARRTFQGWARGRRHSVASDAETGPKSGAARPEIVLWPDTPPTIFIPKLDARRWKSWRTRDSG